MKKLIVLLVAAYFAWDFYLKPADVVKLEPGVEADAVPTLSPITYSDAFTYKEHELIPKADLDMRGKVLSQEPYYFDRGSDVSPVDLAMGWKMMSDQAIVDKFTFRQNMRWFSWHSEGMPVKKLEARFNMANIHIIPSTEEITMQLKSVRTGDIIQINGLLVDVKSKKDAWYWKTSTTFMDNGDHADEILWLENLEILKTEEASVDGQKN
ncbi:hypothetical protein [Thiomicrorhabdus cannonii]|uniref:hypothetical protein n=1 Tax=Thiomicrorhabdus cannonii TaxID=2748011 RepID=UPI0015BBC595|nr:hypothetical protein [Thiomicrorhabdus cannonii]